MEQDAVKCPVLKWSTQAHCLEPQHEVPLSLSAGHCQAPGLLAGHADSTCQKSRLSGLPRRPGSKKWGTFGQGWGLQSSWGEAILSSHQPNLGSGAKVLPLSEAQEGKFPGCVCVCDHIHSSFTESGTCESVSHEAASTGTSRDPADTPYGKRGEKGMMELRKNRWSFFFLSFS